MIENLKEEFILNGEKFGFELCRKSENFGDVPIDYWWMDQRVLYGQRNQKAPNRVAITTFFWAACRHHDSTDDPGAQETFILASLLPHVRSSGARRVFPDAHLSRSKKLEATKSRVVTELESMLRSSEIQPITRLEFRDQTADVLGPPVFENSQQMLYQEFTDALLREACQHVALDSERGLDIASRRWSDFHKSIGRRGGQSERKQILDVISYECRAALHRCYSATWCALLPCLAQKYEFSEDNFLFHRFWHFDNVTESAGDLQARFHLFHGHAFALHPASGTFLKTRTAKQLVGDWLTDPANDEAFGKVLSGILVAVHQYAIRRETYATLRRKQPASGSDDLDELQGQCVEKLSGRSRTKRRKTDAR